MNRSNPDDALRFLQALLVHNPVASALMVLMVGVSLVALWGMPSLIERGLFRPYWFLPRQQWFTPISSGFLHADLAHLFFNGFTFWAFGFALERQIGSGAFLGLYAFGLLVSDAGTWLRHRHDPGYATLGASGAILAVLFASIVYFPSASLYILPIPVPIPAPIFALVYIAFSYYASKHGQGNVNHDAHLSGAAAGVAFVAITDPGALARAVGWVMAKVAG